MRFLLSFFFGILLALVLWFGAFYVLLGTPTSRSAGLAETHDRKVEIMKSTESPRLVFLGGSGTLMGIGADKIEEALGRTAVNFGIFAGFDLQHQFTMVSPYLKQGDILVLAFEYPSYNYDGGRSIGSRDFIFERASQQFLAQPLTTQFQQIFDAGAGLVLKWIVGVSLPEMDRKRQYPLANINLNGDQTINRVSPDKQYYPPRNFKPASFKQTELSPEVKTMIENQVKALRAKGVTVLATYPNTMKFEAYNTPEIQGYIASVGEFYNQLNVPMLGTPQDAMFDQSMIFDTVDHLNAKGVEIRSQRLAEQLRPFVAEQN